MSEYEQAVFISYAWGEDTHEREAIVNELDQSLQKRGLKIIRDKRDLGYKGSIRDFMKSIGEGSCVIVVISDKYLRSKNCMFELVEIAANKQFTDRIFPIILGDANIYNWRGQADYLDHWEKEKAALDERIQGMKSRSNLQGLYEELDDYERFRAETSKLTNMLENMNSLSPDLLRDADFQQIYDAIVKRMPSITSATSNSSTAEKPATKQERKPMDPITLATAATTLLAPFIKKAGAAALDKLAGQLPDTVGKIWSALSNKSDSITEAASDLAQNPDDAFNEENFKRRLQKTFEKDQEFASLMTDLIEAAKSESSKTIGGDEITTSANNNSIAVGKVSVGGNVDGNFVIGNNNQVNNNKK